MENNMRKHAAAAAKSLQSCLTLCDPIRRQPTRLPRPWDSPGKNTGVDCHFLLQCVKVKGESEVAQSCPTLSNPMDCSPPSSSVHGIFQARVLEWGAIAFSDEEAYICIIESLCCRAEIKHNLVNSLSLLQKELWNWKEDCLKVSSHFSDWMGPSTQPSVVIRIQ